MAKRVKCKIFAKKNETVYKWIFYLFCAIGIFKKPQKNNFKILFSIFNVSFNLSIFLFTGITSYSFLYQMEEHYGKRISVYVCFFAVYFSNRFWLCRSVDDFEDFTRMLRRLSYILRLHAIVRPWILVWACSVLCINLYMFLYLLAMFIRHDATPDFLFGLEADSDILRYLISFLYALSYFIFLYMPINVFTIYYVLICRHIRDVIIAFEKWIETVPEPNYDLLNEIYSKIKIVVDFIDAKLGVPVFITFSFNAFTMYLGLVNVLHDKFRKSPGIMFKDTVGVACVSSFLNFVAMIYAADSVHSASIAVKARVRNLKVDVSQSISSYFRFHQNCSEEISLTIWGIFSMRKNIIFGTIGAIFTYSLLFDSVLIEKG